VVYNPAINPHPSASVATATITSLTAQPIHAGAAITFTLATDAAVTVQITNLAGRPVRTLVVDRPCGAGPNAVAWNGLSDAGTAVPFGRYLVRIAVRGADGGQSQAVTALPLHR